MKKIFVSHAGRDASIADKLAEDLKNAGNEVFIDLRELELGDDSIEFMNAAIQDSHVIIILFSKHTKEAKWQCLEINAAVWNENAQSGGTCIVLKLDDSKIPPLLGPKVYGKLDIDNKQNYKTLLNDICKQIMPSEPATRVVSDAFKAESPNPFRRIRAEYFEEKASLLSAAFAAPEPTRAGGLEEIMPCFLEGSRGTGKSMLLLSLRARVYFTRNAKLLNTKKIFGFYLKLTRGAVCNVGIQPSSTSLPSDPDVLKEFNLAQVADVFCQEFVICLLESLLSEIDFCLESGLTDCESTSQRAISEQIFNLLFEGTDEAPRTIKDLLTYCARMHRRIADYIRRKFIYGEEPILPVATCDLEAIAKVIEIVKNTIPSLKDSLFIALLDEYENLFPYQQRVVNTFVKCGPPAFTVKIAKKLGTSDVSATTTGQDLQEINDYSRVPLVYDVEDAGQRRAYRSLLERIIHNILESEGYSGINVATLLPDFSDDEVATDAIEDEVLKMIKLTRQEFSLLPAAVRQEKITYYRESAIYRTLYGHKGRQSPKRFASFGQIAFLSSGVIRYFQEILGVAYYLSFGEDVQKQDPLVLPPEQQSKAVHLVSTHNLTALGRNVETDGEVLKYFLLDLGDCLRCKLLKHGSEPEAARLTIVDPEVLDRPGFDVLRRILSAGTREGVFQTKEGRPAFKPRHSSDPQPSEFNISRVFAPVLQISPRLRWRSEVTCADLNKLLESASRARAKRTLMKSMEGNSGKDVQGSLAWKELR